MTIEPALPAPDAVETTSPLYEQIVEDFLARVEKDQSMPAYAVKNLRAAFAAGPPKSADLVAAFSADEDV